jgi:Putative Ig domain/Right handed beta helix region/Dockerin type I domain
MKNEITFKLYTNKFSRTFILLLLFISFFVFVSVFMPVQRVSASTSVYYVSKTGNDSNVGTLASPWLTISHAASTATAGSTVNIETGTYNEEPSVAHSGTAGNPIIFQNYSGEVVTISGTGKTSDYLFACHSVSYITISGLTLENDTYDINGKGIDIEGSSNIIVQNCMVVTTDSAGILSWYYGSTPSTNITITGCEVTNVCLEGNLEAISLRTTNGFTINNCIVHGTGTQIGICTAIGCTNGSIYGNTVYNIQAMGIYIDSEGATESNFSIYDNICYGCLQAGIGLSSENTNGQYPVTGISIYNNVLYGNVEGFSVGSISVPANTFSFTFINNTLYNNSYEGISLGNYSYISSAVIRNNILDGSSNAILIAMSGSGSNVTVDHNLFYNSGSYNSSNIYGTNYIQANPLLTNPASNFALQLGSPAIDAGASVGAPFTDYMGTARPQGSGYDIGAYEYIVSTPPVSLAITTNSLPNAIVGMAYSQSLTATGGTSPYTWKIVSGTLPVGLSLSSSGVISGTTTTAAGPISVTFQVTDANSETETTVLSIATIYADWDVNTDGVANILDMTLVVQDLGQQGNHGWIREDVNGDGVVNIQDLTLVAQHMIQ